ncbi:hypothetical protein [Staphylococcus gallinarum]|uniref:hypothetical protein n=1 Tax=Staphylococcus gallinarum TaxID=1293 RepID=UPI00317966A7
MMDILSYLRDLINTNEELFNIVEDRIYFYETTENTDVSNTFIILTPITDIPADLVSDTFLSEEHTFQVDIEGYQRDEVVNVNSKIRRLLWDNNMYQLSSQLDLYSDVTKRYVISRRYEGIPKNQYYKGEHIE